MTYIPTHVFPESYSPPALKDESKVLFIAPLTQADFDRLGLELYRHRITEITPQEFRSIMVDEAFVLFGDDEGEQKAELLDQMWLAEDVYGDQIAAWKVQEDQRLFDQAHGAPMTEQAPLPEHPMPRRQRYAAQKLYFDLQEQSDKMRDIVIQKAEYENLRQEGMVRLVLSGWEGFETQREAIGRMGAASILTPACWESLKAELGQEAVKQVKEFVNSAGAIDGREAGNSGSPAGTPSETEASAQPSAASVTSAGTSTTIPSSAAETTGASSIEPIPAFGSAPITGQSSLSTSSSAGGTSAPAATQTAEG